MYLFYRFFLPKYLVMAKADGDGGEYRIFKATAAIAVFGSWQLNFVVYIFM